MARYAIIVDGKVVNTTEWDGDTDKWSPGEGSTAVQSDIANIGDGYADDVFTPATPLPRQPRSQPIACGFATIAANGLVTAVDGFGILSVSRVTTNRYRFFFDQDQPDAAYLVLASGQATSALSVWYRSKTVGYVEIQCSAAATEIVIDVTRILR